MLTMFENTIAAISTSLQDGAISIIRLSGDKAIEITQKIFDRNIMNVKSHTIHYGFIIDTDKNPVDEVLISIFRAPKHIHAKTLSKSIVMVVLLLLVKSYRWY